MRNFKDTELTGQQQNGKRTQEVGTGSRIRGQVQAHTDRHRGRLREARETGTDSQAPVWGQPQGGSGGRLREAQRTGSGRYREQTQEAAQAHLGRSTSKTSTLLFSGDLVLGKRAREYTHIRMKESWDSHRSPESVLQQTAVPRTPSGSPPGRRQFLPY